MENKDMPAMPCDDIVIRDKNGNLQGAPISCTGLTKLEHFAGLAIPPMEMIIESLNQRDGVALIDDYIECAVAYKIKEAKALLAQIEGEGDE